MNIFEAVERISNQVKPQRKAAKACGYSSAHFCALVNAVRRGERISPKAERIIIGYANEIGEDAA
jgi:hypothetical protein